MQNLHKAIAGTAPIQQSVNFTRLAVLMLATPLIFFAIGCAKDSVFLVDGAGALFGIDVTLLLWLRDQWRNTPHTPLAQPLQNKNDPA